MRGPWGRAGVGRLDTGLAAPIVARASVPRSIRFASVEDSTARKYRVVESISARRTKPTYEACPVRRWLFRPKKNKVRTKEPNMHRATV